MILSEFQEIRFFADFDKNEKGVAFPLFQFWQNSGSGQKHMVSIQNLTEIMKIDFIFMWDL